MTAQEEYFLKGYESLMELIAGGCCGLAVDSILFPIDTCKTRLQSEEGFQKSGGFKGIYNGVLPVIAGSVPTAALFFCVVSIVTSILKTCIVPADKNDDFLTDVYVNVIASMIGEMCSDSIRVPIEIVKQKRQVSEVQFRAIDILMHAYKTDGFINGVYRGYGITVMRDVPFSIIQYPLWKFLKGLVSNVFAEACCGSVAGAVASAITTPLDVAKTRIQLAETDKKGEYNDSTRNPIKIWRDLYREHGIQGVFSGFVPRVLWTTIGGFIYFGTYSGVLFLLKSIKSSTR